MPRLGREEMERILQTRSIFIIDDECGRSPTDDGYMFNDIHDEIALWKPLGSSLEKKKWRPFKGIWCLIRSLFGAR